MTTTNNDTTTEKSANTEQKKGMTGKECMKVIEQLASAQGFYTRLNANLKEMEQNDTARFSALMQTFESKNFSDPADLVIYLET